MMNHYETVFITTPVLSEAQVKETVKKVKDFLLEENAQIVYENNWGLRKLAYPIQNKSTGYYYLIEFKAEGDLVSRLEIMYKRNERIIRFLTVKMDKHAVAYSEKCRSNKQSKQQKEKQTVNEEKKEEK